VVASVPDRPALVIATPGAEPIAAARYAAVVLLDGDRMLDRHDLRADEEALRRWFAAAALCRGRDEGGVVVIVADSSARPVQALVRWDPHGHAREEFDARAATRMPPAVRAVTVTGTPSGVASMLEAIGDPGVPFEVLGPTPVAPAVRRPRNQAAPPPVGGDESAVTDGLRVRALLRTPLGSAAVVALAIKQAAGVRSARKDTDAVAIRVDPLALG
jgi:primosomal protein N' (replication factor Y)